jgi:hypothetical protein
LDTKGKILAFVEPPKPEVALAKNDSNGGNSPNKNDSLTDIKPQQPAAPVVIVNSNFSWNVLTAVT